MYSHLNHLNGIGRKNKDNAHYLQAINYYWHTPQAGRDVNNIFYSAFMVGITAR